MITDLIAIFRARKNPRLATRLAARFAQGQALDRLTSPLFIIQIILWAVIVLCGILSLAALWAGIAWHWAAAIPALLPLLIGYCAIRVEAGLRKGMGRVRLAAETMTDRGMDTLLREHPPLSRTEG